jgi:hypothetical protein
MNMMVYTHCGYLAIGIAVTVWVVHTLQRGGWPFLVRRFRGDEPLADAWSHLLAVGMYLLHVGCLLLALRLGTEATSRPEALELLATKLGVVLLALAATHFLHLGLFWELHRRERKPTAVAARPLAIRDDATPAV